MARIVVSDPLAEEGIQVLADAGHDVVDITALAKADRDAAVAEAEAWIIRSGTRLDAKALAKAAKLRAVGRAGVGVDNVDLDACTRRGIAVFNAPTGNITSAAEQAWALMLAAARRVPEADSGMKRREWLRKELKGTELAGKTLLIVGLGRIGRMMAARAQAFEMNTIGYDPFVTEDAARGFGVRTVSLEAGFEEADVVTLHTPLTPQTRGMVDGALLGHATGIILVNAARGGLIDEAALLKALEEGRVRAAGIDVWEQEPPQDWSLARHPRVVAAPHLGASTVEAQRKAAVQVCERVVAFLRDGDAGQAVNAVVRAPEPMRPWLDLVEALAGFAVQTLPGPLDSLTVTAHNGLDGDALQVHALVGALRAGTDEPVNAINASRLAAAKGWSVAHRGLPDVADRFMRLEARGGKEGVVIEGTYTPHYGARVTRIDGFDVEFRPRGRFLFTRHRDVPGVLARITGILAEVNVNVANVSLARDDAARDAVAVIQVDGGIPREARDRLRTVPEVTAAHRIRLGPS